MVHSSGLPSFVRLLSFAVLFLLSVLSTWQTAFAAGPGIPVTWLTATSGDWTDATKWSNSVYPNNGSPTPTDTYEVTLNSLGAAHTVTLQNNVAVNSLTLDSPNVTFLHSNGILTTDLITLNQGVYQFGSDSLGFPSGHEIVGATIVGNGGEFRIGRKEPSTHILRDVVLDIDLAVPASGGSPNSAVLTIKDGLTIADNRTLLIEPRFAKLLVSGSQSIDGEGQILFSNPTNASGSGAIVLTSGTTLTLGSDLEVKATNGRGSFNAESDSAVVNIVNHGLISSSVQNWSLQIFDYNPAYPATFENWGVVEAVGQGRTIVGGQWINHGTFRIRDSGILELAGSYKTSELGIIDRQGGTLRLGGTIDNVGLTFAANASTGNIQIGGTGGSGQSKLIGGRLTTSDSAAFVIQDVDLQDVILSGDANISQNYSVDIIGDLTLDNGQLRLSSTNDLSDSASIRFPDRDIVRSIRGTGSIAFAAGRVNRLFIDKELSIESGITVETRSGDGDILGPKLVNHGTLRSLTGGTLTLSIDDFVNHGVIDVAGIMSIGRDNTAARWLNEGEIRIRSGGRLTLRGVFEVEDLGTVIDEGADYVRLSGILENQGKTLDLESLNLSVPFTLNGGRIRGGRIESSGNAKLGFSSGSSTSGIFDGVTLGTDVDVNLGPGGRVAIENGLTLDNTTITMREGTTLAFTGSGSHELKGIGTIFAPDQPNTGAITTISGDRLVIGDGIVIRTGTTAYRELRIGFQENRGLIIAEAPNTLVTISADSPNGRWKNNGTIRALAGTLVFAGTYKPSDIGNLEVLGSQVNLTGNIDNVGEVITQNAQTGAWRINANVTGGRIESTDGVVPLLSGSLTNVTIAGLAKVGAGISNEQAMVREKLILDNASLTISVDALLGFNTVAAIEGNGEIFLNGTLAKPALLQTFNGGAITIGPAVQVKTGPIGGGQISRDMLPFVNQGTVSAQTLGQRIVIGGAFQNTGLLEARNESLLLIQSSNWVNQGVMEVYPRSEIRITGTQFENGTNGYLGGNGLIALTTATLVNRGTIAPGNSIGTLSITGKAELTATSVLEIELGKDGAKDLLSATGNVTLGGTLAVLKGDDFNAQLGRQYEILRSTLGQITGTFSNPGGVIQVGFVQFAIGYTSKSVILTTTAIPEPSGVLLFVLAIATLWIHSSKLQFRNMGRTGVVVDAQTPSRKPLAAP